ncbi:hypothetical protein [Novosphingobium sp. AP12]|uniref:hypothetical protein n=1 Tax=Novosphingobium sp. AP12 TaxID=1144305 RepID=UPI00027214D3|nr:hypothetical protein [Novosphingobium sp. AP12]EJL30239.1 hypothetical protein PMI02_02058 [Novosphingobium sp. AP12]
MIRKILPLVVALTVSSPVFAQDKPAEPARSDPEKVICRSTSKTGSYIAKRECHTAAVWKELSTATTNVSEQAIDKLKTTRVLKGNDF